MVKLIFVGMIVMSSTSILTASAEAKGCIKGAVVGGIAGHLAGHGKVGAAAGCAVGHHNANKKDQQQNVQGADKK